MACVTLEGTLWIELADVYTWLEQAGIKTDGCKGLRFSIEDDALQLEFDGKDPVSVDAAEFWAWVIEAQLPKGIPHYETVFGVPKESGADLVITFAAGSETNPRGWSTPPACLAEWKPPAADKNP